MFYDLESVQVLKGPQGTLFGRNTTGGAVLFEPHRATYENGGYAKVSVGNHGFHEFEGVLNLVPLQDKVALRVAGQVSRRDGYTTSVVDGQKLDERRYEAFRATLRLDPAPGIESSTIFDYRTKDGTSGSEIFTAAAGAQCLSDIRPREGGQLRSGAQGRLEHRRADPIPGVITAGRQIAKQPKWTYGLSGVYTLPIAEDAGELTLSANWSWRTDVFNANTPTLVSVDPAYWLLNARFDWKNILARNVDLGIFATNLLDKDYVQAGYPIPQVGFQATTYGEPRMFGASLTLHFGAR